MINFILLCLGIPIAIGIYFVTGILALQIVWAAYEKLLYATGDFVDGTENLLEALMDFYPFVWPVILPIIGLCMIYRTILACVKKFGGSQ